MTLPVWLPIIALLWLLAVLFLPIKGSYGEDPALAFYFEKYIFPWHLAIVMGYYCSAEPTGQWAENKDLWLIALAICVLFMFFIQVIRRKSILLFVRDIVTEGALFATAYGIDMLVNFLRNGFLSGFPSVILIPIEFIIGGLLLAMLPISFIIWLIPTSSLAKINHSREEKERNKMKQRAATYAVEDAMRKNDLDSPHSVTSMPSVITGPYNHSYKLIGINSFSAEYQSEHDSSIVTIHDSDINASGQSANITEGYFYW